jgi:glycosyltransferase involved in cell wall biosynthesis
MRILIISQQFPPEKSGNASRIFDLSRNLSKLGDEVTVLAPYPNFPPGSFERKWSISSSKEMEGVKLINLLSWQPAKQDPGFINRMAYYLTFPIHTTLWSFLNYKKYDVIITSAPPIFTGFAGLFSSIIFKKKWMMDIRDLWINASISLGFLKKGSLFEKMSRKYEQICYSRCDLIGVTTEELGEDIVRTYKDVGLDKIKVVPNGVDTEFFQPLDIEKKNQIIYTGNIGHAQDLGKVMLAVKKINENYDLKFLIVGDGDIKNELEELAIKENITDIVEFTGSVSRDTIPTMLSESLIGIAPLKKMKTLEYAVPTKAYEYMACQIPFVGCGKGEIRKLAENSEGGVIADNSVDDIADTILSLLNNPEKMQDMGIRGRSYVEKNYSRRQIADDLRVNLHNIYTEKTNVDSIDGTIYAESK